MRETNKARQAFEDYYQLGPGRSLSKLHRLYMESATNPATKSYRWLAEWSRQHNWQDRVRERDDEIAKAQMNEIIQTATQTGYAVFQKRIHDLGRIAERLFKLLEVGPLEPSSIREFRGLLGDIAAETGGRETRHSLTLSWRSDIVELLRSGELDPEIVLNDLGEDLATELFVAAGVSLGESREVEAASEPGGDLA